MVSLFGEFNNLLEEPLGEDDFVSDQVVAPVRESTAMALGHLIKLMPNEDLILAIINVLIVFADHSAWECRHGAFLGMYILKIC